MEYTKSIFIEEIEQAINDLCEGNPENVGDAVIRVLEAIRIAITNDEDLLIPIELSEKAIATFDPKNIKAGDVIEGDELSFKPRTIMHPDGYKVLVGFTNQDEIEKGGPTSIININIDDFLCRALLFSDVEGIAINPWGNAFTLNKEMIKRIFEGNLPVERENIICITTADITTVETTAIVNAANETLLGGGGVDGAIHRAAGPELKEACRKLNGCRTGEAKITPGFNLKANHVIHTVGPIYSGKPEDAEMLRRCYWNSLELARENDIHSIAFPAISTGVYGYPKGEAAYIALLTVNEWMLVNPHYGMAVMMACFDKETEELYHQIYAENEEVWNRRDILSQEEGSALLEEAITFAIKKHSGGTRKGTEKPYILHPLETLQIVANVTETDYPLMAAAVLHDVLEDTDSNTYELLTYFDKDVAYLVNSHTEDKRNNWYMRKLYTIEELRKANIRVKLLAFADKLANLRSIHKDYQMIGDELWERFNAPKAWQAWYYGNLQDVFSELQDFPEAAELYWEMAAKYKDVFVDFYIDESKEMLYQIGADGESYALKKGKPQWNPYEGKLSKKAKLLSRKDAERIEDNWAEPFWTIHEQDMSDGEHCVHSSDTTYIGLQLKNGEVHIYYDRLDDISLSNVYILHNEDAHRFMTQLRLKYSLRNKLSTILKTEFEGDNSMMKILDFCNQMGISVEVVRF